MYKEIHGAVAKSYMRKGFQILYMRKCAIFNHEDDDIIIYDFATAPF